jgi:hypothetical protein
MTRHHPALTAFSAPWSGSLADVARAAIRNGAAHRHTAHIKALSALEPRMLDDIGMAGFCSAAARFRD